MAVFSSRAVARAAGAIVVGLLGSGAALAGPVQFKAGDILTADPNADALLRVNATTGATSVLLSGGLLDEAFRVNLSPDGKNLYVLARGGRIVRIDVASGATTQIASDLEGHALDVQSDGSLIVAGRVSGSPGNVPGLYRLDADGTNRQTIAETVSGTVTDLAIEAGGNSVVYTDPFFADITPGYTGPGEAGGGVFRVDLTTGLFNPVSTAGDLINARSITLTPNGGTMVVGDQGFEGVESDGRVIAVDPVTGQQILVSSGNLLQGVFGLDFDANGRLIVANPDDGILVIDPATGTQSLLATGFFTDVEVAGVNAIPLPAAAWAGLLVMGALAARRGLGRLTGR